MEDFASDPMAMREMRALTTDEIAAALQAYTNGSRELLPYQHALWPRRLMTVLSFSKTNPEKQVGLNSAHPGFSKFAEHMAEGYSDDQRSRYFDILAAYQTKRSTEHFPSI